MIRSRSLWLAPALLAAPLLSGILAAITPGVAVAAEAAATSPLTGIPLPKGAQRLTQNDLPGKFALLLNAAGGEIKLPAVEGKAEVLLWTTRPGRGPFVRTAVQTALKEAGYHVEDISEDRIYKTNPFDDQFGLSAEPIRISSIDQRGYFTARNEQKRQTLVCGWILGDERIIIALAPTGFKEGPKEAPLPGVSGANVLLVKDINDAMKGIAPFKTPAFPKMAPKPGTVRGMVKDAGGNPIAGAQIIAQSSAAGGFRTDSRARTNAQGVYEVVLPVGVCQVVNADCTVRYNDKSYLLPLHPVDGERDHFNSKDGHIEHFVLRTWGPAGPNAEQSPQFGSNYYGGHIRLLEYVDEGGTFEVTLEPQGPLLGGVKGRTLVFRFPNKGGSEVFLNDIPIGRYLLRARLLDGGEALPLRVKMTFGESTPAASLQVDFEAENGDLASLERSGIKRFDISLEP